MSNRFLSSHTNTYNLTNGTVDVFASTLSANNLLPSLPVRTDANKRLITSQLAIKDIVGLQNALNNISTAPGSGNMNYVGAGTVVGQHYLANDTTGLNANNSSMVETGSLITLNKNLAVGSFKISQNPVALGSSAGTSGQSTGAVAVGNFAGTTNQGTNSVAVGNTSANFNQGASSVAVGVNAGNTTQGGSCVAIGSSAGASAQGVSSVAIGSSAGNTSQGASSVAVGGSAGQTSQGAGCVAIGSASGNSGQLAGAVSIGVNAGNANQGVDAIAIGRSAGASAQGTNAIAIGELAGQTSQGANSIILNASGSALNATTDGLYVKPVRPLTTQVSQGTLKYSTANEVYYDATALGLGMNYVGPATVVGQMYIANDTTGLNANQSALVEDAEKISFNGERILMSNPTTFGTENYMIKMTGINNSSYEQYGIHINGISSTTDVYGIVMNVLQADNDSYGFSISSVGSTGGLTYGGKIDSVRSDTTHSVGLEIKRVGDSASAGKNGTGLYITQTVGGSNSADEARGIHIESIDGGGSGYGVIATNIDTVKYAFFTNVNGMISQNVIGHFLTGLDGSNLCKGFECNGATSLGNTIGLSLSTLTSGINAYGILGQTIQGDGSCYGSYFTTIGSSTGDCTGYSIESITAELVAYGFYADAILSNTSDAYGSYITNITANTDAFGSLIKNVNGSTAKGQFISDIDGTTQCIGIQGQVIKSTGGSAYGMVLSGITGRQPTYGTYITGINSANSTTTGSLIENVISTGGKSTGIEAYRITALTDATGILVSDVQSSGGGDVYGIKVEGLIAPLGRSYGCYLTNNNTSTDQFGFYQDGTLNQGNVLEAQTTIGAQSGTATALVVNGCMKTSVQRTSTTPFTINKNTGNTVISTVVGASSLVLPAVASTEDGLTFSIFHRGTGTITVSGSGGQTINGSATFAFPATGGFTYMTILWDNTANDWFAHVN